MKKITLQFPSLLHLVEYQLSTETQKFDIHINDRTLSGPFTEAAIELAKAGFGAEVVTESIKQKIY